MNKMGSYSGFIRQYDRFVLNRIFQCVMKISDTMEKFNMDLNYLYLFKKLVITSRFVSSEAIKLYSQILVSLRERNNSASSQGGVLHYNQIKKRLVETRFSTPLWYSTVSKARQIESRSNFKHYGSSYPTTTTP